MAVTPLLSWRRRDGSAWKPGPLLRFVLVVAGLFLVGCIPALYYAWRGNNAPALFVFTSAVTLALITNSAMLVKTARQGLLQTGAWVMHVGFCLALIGVISTSVYSVDTRLKIGKGETWRLYGYDLTYTGLEPQKNGRDVLALKVQRGDWQTVARPRSFEHKGQHYNTPYILKFWDKDVYIAPEGTINQAAEGELKRGLSGRMDNLVVTFERFVLKRQVQPDQPIDVGVALSISDGSQIRTVEPHMIVRPDGSVISPPVETPGGTHLVRMKGVKPNQEHPEESTVSLQFIPKNPVDVAAFTVSTKPYVNVLWLGGYMMFLGGIIAWRRRASIAAKAREKSEEPEPEPTPEGKEPAPAIRPRRRPQLQPEPAAMRSLAADEG
jgi:cytochrome c-type biogenesis protein CcmF